MYASGMDRPWKGVPKELDEAEWSEVSESSDEEMTDRSTGAERRRARKAYVSSWPGHPMDVDKAVGDRVHNSARRLIKGRNQNN